MGAVPKRRISKGRRDRRRAHYYHVDLPHLVECSHCHKPMLPHRVCPSCGFYRGEQIVEVKEE